MASLRLNVLAKKVLDDLPESERAGVYGFRYELDGANHDDMTAYLDGSIHQIAIGDHVAWEDGIER